MKLLVFDTALGRGAVAVFVDGQQQALVTEPDQRALAEQLVPMIEAVLSDAGLCYGDLDRIGVTIGPGTFTGLRIGVATARALALATDVPAVGISTLEALAHSFWATRAELPSSAPQPATAFSVVQDARRGQVFVQNYQGQGPQCVAQSDARAEDLADAPGHFPSGAVLIGTGADSVAAIAEFSTDAWEPEIDMAALARLVIDAPAPNEPPSPLYLRGPDAKLPGGKTLKQASAESGAA